MEHTNKDDRDDRHNLMTSKWPWRDKDPTVQRAGISKRFRQVNAKRVQKLFTRMGEWIQRLLTKHPKSAKMPVFVFGSNRSGTQMVCEAIGNSLHGWDYQESEANIAFKDYQLRADWIVKSLIRMTPAPIVSFGNILDSQFADELLMRFDNAKSIWVYRRYEDAANSSVHKWGSHFKNDMVRWVARGRLDKLGNRGKRISPETIQLFKELYHDDMSNEDGACLYWYMRNQLYFELHLHENPNVLLVQYEDTVLNQEKAFQRIFDFLGFPYAPEIISNIFAGSVNKHPWPGIDPRIKEVCDALKIRLDTFYAKAR